jgi:hypothetical protein
MGDELSDPSESKELQWVVTELTVQKPLGRNLVGKAASGRMRFASLYGFVDGLWRNFTMRLAIWQRQGIGKQRIIDYLAKCVKVGLVSTIVIIAVCQLPVTLHGQTVAPLYGAQANFPYAVQLGVTVSGTYPFTFSAIDKLPDGLSLSSTGLVSGTPIKSSDEPYEFRIKVLDARNVEVGNFSFSIRVTKEPPVIVIDSDSKPPTAVQMGALKNGTARDERAAKVATAKPEQTNQNVETQTEGSQQEISPDKAGRLQNSTTAGARPETKAADSSGEMLEKSAPIRSGEEARVIIGYQQAGASAAKSQQDWFFDFYGSRPLKLGGDYARDTNPVIRWWGNVRVASYPQQGDIPVATFASSLTQQFGQLKVNQLAQAAEFLTGLEFRLSKFDFSFLGRSENDTRQRFSLGLIVGGGATGPLDPVSTLSLFETPAATSPQRARFLAKFPQAAGSQFIGFVSPDRDKFLRQYFAGFRLTTHYADGETRDPLTSPPALVSVSLGQNEVVTGGRMQGIVMRTEAFYPLPFGNRKDDKRGALAALYLFGTAQMRLGGTKNIDPFILNPVNNIDGSDPRVAIVTSPSNRDIYRIGFGVDFIHMITTLIHKDSSEGNPATPK